MTRHHILIVRRNDSTESIPGAPLPTDDDYRLLFVQIQAAQRIAARLRLPMLHHILSITELEAIKSFRDNGAANTKPPRPA